MLGNGDVAAFRSFQPKMVNKQLRCTAAASSPVRQLLSILAKVVRGIPAATWNSPILNSHNLMSRLPAEGSSSVHCTRLPVKHQFRTRSIESHDQAFLFST